MIATTGNHLLEAIRADPADDLPRLAYADWLEENGDERSCWQAGMIRGTWDASRPARFITTFPELSRLEAAIDRVTGIESMRIIDDFVHCGAPVDAPGLVMIRRGFVHTIRCPLAVWLEHGPAVVKAHPVERVEVTDRAPHRFADSTPRSWRFDDGGWSSTTGEDPSHSASLLPEELFRWLLSSSKSRTFEQVYPSEAEALAALSAALIALARR